jgi:hypothetical protein
MNDLPAWLCPPAPPPAEGRKINRLDPLPPDSEPSGLKAYRKLKRQEYLDKIKAMGLTEKEYVRLQKAKAAKKRRAPPKDPEGRENRVLEAVELEHLQTK